MAQGFKLVLRPSKPGEKDSEKKFYAVSKTNGTSSMKTLCKLISARSTVSSADVKAVLDNLNLYYDIVTFSYIGVCCARCVSFSLREVS